MQAQRTPSTNRCPLEGSAQMKSLTVQLKKKKPQDFYINHTTATQYDHFRTSAVPRHTEERREVEDDRREECGFVFFSLCPNKEHLN